MPWTLDHGLASQLAVVEAEMLPHMTSVNQYYFPAVIVPVLVLYPIDYQPRSAGMRYHDSPVQLSLISY